MESSEESSDSESELQSQFQKMKRKLLSKEKEIQALQKQIKDMKGKYSRPALK